MLRALILSFILTLCACSSADKINTNTAEGAFKLAQKYEKDERYDEAVTYYAEVKNKYPYSRFATDAELKIGDIEFTRENYVEAEGAYKLFKEFHPTHPRVDYVTFRLGLSVFHQLPPTTDRDLKLANVAIEYFDQVLNLYGKSQFAKEASEFKKKAQHMLAEKANYIADFYFIREKWESALGRYEDILQNHMGQGYDIKALYGATVAAYRMKEMDKAKTYFKRLLAEYPDSKELPLHGKSYQMDSEGEFELFQIAEEHFKENRYGEAEPALNQLVLKKTNRPEVFHMLGTIYYDQGKFNKAIRSFYRSLEIDPGFTDASIGLSIILNDLGRYEEGQKIFDEARAMLAVKGKGGDPHLNEKFATKHDELGELYFRHHRFAEALEQFQKAQQLTSIRRPELAVSIANCHTHLGNMPLAIRELRAVVREYGHYVPARLKLGKCHYDSHQIPEAIEQWEAVLQYEPKNAMALDYLRLAQTVQVTQLNAPQIEF